MTQKQWILNRMRRYDKVTTLDAFRVGITRISARIYELRWNDSQRIISSRKRVKTCWGKTWICEYRLTR
jgi:O-acetyl-ADP-ribose deacetylase (regulator of RNase III)